MRNRAKSLLAGAIGLTLLGAGAAQAFSFSDSTFSFGSNDWGNPYWGAPGYGPGYGPGYAPGYFMPPRLPAYDRIRMMNNRQQQMRGHGTAIDDLGDLLFRRYGKSFDREEAVQLAREIEASSGPVLLSNFHPGAVVTDGSRVAPSYWGNEQAFQANAMTLQAAATALVEELQKVPTDEEKPLYLSTGPFSDPPRQKVPVSRDVWSRFNDVAATCDSCHRSFRGYRW